MKFAEQRFGIYVSFDRINDTRFPAKRFPVTKIVSERFVETFSSEKRLVENLHGKLGLSISRRVNRHGVA